ncbi:MAG: type II toxin-antitoxin system HicB family antitoxin [FCB group bacterium]|jgi:predicted RNase H-like HicB family nuclease
MLQNYITNALNQAKYEILPEDGSIYGEIPICNGVYAKASSFEECRKELIEVLEEWIILRLRRNLGIPVIENASLNILEIADAAN